MFSGLKNALLWRCVEIENENALSMYVKVWEKHRLTGEYRSREISYSEEKYEV